MNKLLENIYSALISLLSNKLRALLTTLGIGIGIAAVTVLVSLGQSVQAYVNKQIMGVGTDLIYVRPGSTSSGPTGSTSGGSMPSGGGMSGPNPFRVSTSELTEKDVELLQDPFSVPNVKAVVPLLQFSRSVDYGSKEVRLSVYGTTAPYFETVNRTVGSGRLFDDQDVLSNSRVAVLGETTVNNLFGDGTSPIGETIRVGEVPFKVIGTLQKSGGGGFGSDPDNLIVVPLTTAHTKLQTERSVSGKLPVSTIYLKASNTQAIDGIVENVTTLLRHEHKIKPGKDDDFQVSTQKDLLASFDAIIGVLTVFLAVIGGISLLVGGIGVMNIMLVTVTERTREIGLRKAVGARGTDVLLQFLTEAIMLCLVGGIAGLIVAFLFVAVLKLALPDLDPSVNPQSVILAVSVTSCVGLFFGIYPASRAAALSPISALRFE
jgi:putative ABC transport system permease protein